MNERVDNGKPAQARGGKRHSQSQPDAGLGRKQPGQTDPQHKQADRRSVEVKEEEAGPQARTADSSPGNPPGDRVGTASPDGPVTRRPPADERVAVAEPGRGQLSSADPRIDIGTADSTPAPDGGPTGSDRDTLKPGV